MLVETIQMYILYSMSKSTLIRSLKIFNVRMPEQII